MKKIALAFASSMVLLTIITLPSCDQPAVVPKHYIFDTTGAFPPPPPTGTLNVTCFKGSGQIDQGATVRVFLSQDDLNKGQNQLFPDQDVNQFTGTATFTLPSPKGEALPTCSSGKPSVTYYVYGFHADPGLGFIQDNGSKDVCATKAHAFSVALNLH